MTTPVFFASAEALAALEVPADFTLTGPEARHAATVRRLQPGEAVEVVDGGGRRVSGIVTAADPAGLTLRVTRVVDEPLPEPQLVLVQALAKGGRDEMAIESATELGVDGIVPWQAERSIVRWKQDKARKGRQKWVSTVEAAAKQARRARIPAVSEMVDGRGLAALVSSCRLALLLHEDAAGSLASAIEPLRQLQAGRQDNQGDPDRGSPERILLIVGPEGGISPAEVEELSRAGAVTARLGGQVLRSSTAGPAALAVLSERLGRWA